jgi:hypothetical protein
VQTLPQGSCIPTDLAIDVIADNPCGDGKDDPNAPGGNVLSDRQNHKNRQHDEHDAGRDKRSKPTIPPPQGADARLLTGALEGLPRQQPCPYARAEDAQRS